MTLAALNRLLLEQLAAAAPGGRLWVAYSGGLDSSVLLHLLAALRPALAPLTVQALHIHHGLQAQADAWQQHCEATCAALQIPCVSQRIQVTLNPGESLEAAARLARYQAFSAQLAPGDCLLTAQHADDQAETLLLQLLRGAGPAGLAAMPAQRALGAGWLLRPLLSCTRDELAAYAAQHGLHWVEDGSNQDDRYDRNYLRLHLLPILRQRWPSYAHSLGRAARHQAQAASLLSALAVQDGATALAHPAAGLAVSTLLALPWERRVNLLRHWLQQQGVLAPPERKLQQILTQIAQAAPDRLPLVRWTGAELRRYREHLYVSPPLPKPPDPAQVLDWPQLSQTLALPLGRLSATLAHSGLQLPPQARLQIRFRQGGEHLRCRGQLKSVKKYLQTQGLAPWLRPFLPLLYLEETLVAVPGLGVADAYYGQPGWQLRWE